MKKRICKYSSLSRGRFFASRLLCPWDSPGKNTRVGCHSLLQGIFPTQGSNLGLLHCRQILYHLSHQGSPKTSLKVLAGLHSFLEAPGENPSLFQFLSFERLFAFLGSRLLPPPSKPAASISLMILLSSHLTAAGKAPLL